MAQIWPEINCTDNSQRI